MVGGVFDDDDSSKGEILFDAPIVRGLSVIVLSSVEGVCCGRVGTTGSKMCFREFMDVVSCLVSHTKHKVTLELAHQSTLFCVDGGASSTTLLLETCLITTGIGETDLQNMLHTLL